MATDEQLTVGMRVRVLRGDATGARGTLVEYTPPPLWGHQRALWTVRLDKVEVLAGLWSRSFQAVADYFEPLPSGELIPFRRRP